MNKEIAIPEDLNELVVLTKNVVEAYDFKKRKSTHPGYYELARELYQYIYKNKLRRFPEKEMSKYRQGLFSKYYSCKTCEVNLHLELKDWVEKSIK